MGCLKITANSHKVPSNWGWRVVGTHSVTGLIITFVRKARTLSNKEEMNKSLKFVLLLVLLRKDDRWLGVCYQHCIPNYKMQLAKQIGDNLIFMFFFLRIFENSTQLLSEMLHFQEHCKSHSMRSFSMQEYLKLIIASGHFFLLLHKPQFSIISASSYIIQSYKEVLGDLIVSHAI